MKSPEDLETERTARVLGQGLDSKTLRENVITLTWQDIKTLSNSLTDEQLSQQVKYWTEGSGGKVDDANVLDEDYVSDGEVYAPKSEMAPEAIDEDEPVFPKGTVMLWIL